MTKSNFQKMGFIGLCFQVITPHWGRKLEAGATQECWLMPYFWAHSKVHTQLITQWVSFLTQPRATCTRMVLFTVDWTLLYQLIIKTIPHKCPYRPFWSSQFLSSSQMTLGFVTLQLRAIQDKDGLALVAFFFFLTSPPPCVLSGKTPYAMTCMYTSVDNLGYWSLPYTLLEKSPLFFAAYTRIAGTWALGTFLSPQSL